MVLQNVNKTLELKYDRKIWISVGKSRNSTNWTNKKLMWSEFLTQLQFSQKTRETHSEYLAMNKLDQDQIKDIGGFVGGDCAKGRRKIENITSRCLVTLDADDIKEPVDAFYKKVAKLNCTHAVYSTHKHLPDCPRLRIIFLLNRNVSPDEYQAIARRMAEMIDIETMDRTTYEINRLMYWPSTPIDINPFFRFADAPMLDADEILDSYPDWKDQSYWPKSSKEITEIAPKNGSKPEDPREKDFSIIGAFCSVYYPISAAIETHLVDVYKSGTIEGRYTYINGTTSNGLITDDLFAYSNHSTDPANNGHSHNAFDLVRIHKFGNEKDSLKLMTEWAANDPNTALYIDELRRKEYSESLNEVQNDDWVTSLRKNKKGECLVTPQNLMIIFKNDPELNGFKYDIFADKIKVFGDVPYRKFERERDWDDRDMANLRIYLEVRYGIKGKEVIQDAFENCITSRAYHPVKEYLESLIWDGRKRLETIFIDCFGAVDNEYVRTATRIMMVAAVARIYEPGIKFDNMVVLIGKQGIRKSSLLQALGMDKWFTALGSGLGKEAYEIIQGRWIVEIEELSSFKRNIAEAIKAFITNRFDRFRPAYGRFATDHPRQCVFFGTTNTAECLQDATGNRRFWPIELPEKADLSKLDVDQIWAEAVTIYKKGQKLFMDGRIELLAEDIQKNYTEESAMAGVIQEFLNTPIPENWYEMTREDQWAYYHDDLTGKPKELVKRNKICALEIWEFVYGNRMGNLERWKAKEINDMLKDIPGWKKRNIQFGRYGKQRGFTR